jgi:FAD/FMN-containing dehydrogenase
MSIATHLFISARPNVFAASSLDELRSQLTGDLITPGHADYDEARKVLNFMVDRHPLAIVKAASAEDVAAAVNFARENDIPLAIRSGGHSLAQYSIIDGAIIVDFTAFKRVEVDPQIRIAQVQPGATSRDIAAVAGPHGLALTTGDTHSVGIGGLATGGGIGYMVRQYGLTVDSLLSAQVVTAAGEMVTASQFEHPDLFWAIRGGGGNFGIVTEFTFRLAPVDQILGGEILIPATREVIRGYLDYVINAPEELTTIANLILAPPFPFVPEEHVGEMVFSIIVCWTGNIEEGMNVIAPLRALGTPVADTVGPMPYPEIYKFTEHYANPHGASIRSMFTDDFSDATIDATLDAMRNASSPFSLIQFRGLGGAMARVDSDATAFAHRDRRYFLAIIAVWLDPSENPEVHAAWTGSLWQKVRHEGGGAYVNFLEREGADRIRDAYPETTYAHMAEVKQKYDPDNLFRFNQNIAPKR